MSGVNIYGQPYAYNSSSVSGDMSSSNENSWNITGNDIGDSTGVIGTNDDNDFNIIRNETNKITISSDNVSFNNNKISSVANPESDQDVATKKYVDSNLYTTLSKLPPLNMITNEDPTPYIASDNTASDHAYKAFTHEDGCEWQCETSTGAWVQIKGDERFIVKKIIIYGAFPGSPNDGTIYDWKIEGSNDETSWTTLANQSHGSITETTKLYINLPNNKLGFTTYRFTCEWSMGSCAIDYIGLYNNISNYNVYGDFKMEENLDMNFNTIINLNDPTSNQQAATKKYVDDISRSLRGYIPLLESTNSVTGFIASASSTYSATYSPHHAFYSLSGDWATAGVNTNFWIKIQCPEQVRIGKVALRGRHSTETERIYNWRLEGSNDDITYSILYTAPNPTYIGSITQFFNISTINKYQYYRLFCVEAEATYPGLSYFQIFTY